MESVSPVNEKSEPISAAESSAPITPNTPDPHAATQPVRIAPVQDLSTGIKPEPEPTTDLEDTKPILVREPTVDGAAANAAPTTLDMEALPAWLIAFAQQETAAETAINPAEDTKEIPLEVPQAVADDTGQVFVLPVTADQPEIAESGWTLENVTEPAAPLNKVEEGEGLPEPASPLPDTDSAEEFGTETPDPNPTEPQETAEADLMLKDEFARALDEGNTAAAATIIEEMEKNPEFRKDAIRVLRSRLDTRPESLPLWDFFARLSAADDQPGLSQKARETAEEVKKTIGE